MTMAGGDGYCLPPALLRLFEMNDASQNLLDLVGISFQRDLNLRAAPLTRALLCRNPGLFCTITCRNGHPLGSGRGARVQEARERREGTSIVLPGDCFTLIS
jgi:hypothetical protein